MRNKSAMCATIMGYVSLQKPVVEAVSFWKLSKTDEMTLLMVRFLLQNVDEIIVLKTLLKSRKKRFYFFVGC